MNFVPRPAPIPKRVLAGAIDAACIIVLAGISFVAPLLTKGVVLPMWGVLAVLIGYSVLPIAFFKKTLGLSVAGLEVVAKTGHALDLGNTLFRELLGRGWFPAAYVFTILVSVVASKLGVGGSVAPAMVAGVMTVACSSAMTIAFVGHLIVLGRPDQRSLADLMSGSFVVEGPALPLPTDVDELFEHKRHRMAVLRNVAIVEVVLVLGVYASPFVLAAKGGETSVQKGQRLKVESLQAKFDRDPGSESLARELQTELWRANRLEDAKQVAQRHREAMSLKEVKREEELRAQFAQAKDRAIAQALIQLLEEQDRVPEARDVYAEWLGETPEASELSGFGHWLATNGLTDEAVTVLTRATTMDPLVPFGHTLLGVSLQRMGQLAGAREELELALLDDPSDEDAKDALREVEEKLGPLPAADKKKLAQHFAGWKTDAGR
jgi:uncharacterized RDD family membrane protein YckC